MKIIESFDEFDGILPGITKDKTVDSWVNIKIDRDLHLRISRYIRAVENNSNRYDITAKLDLLTNYNKIKSSNGKMAIMIIMQYLKEIKNNFDGSPAGFLFEDFLAGLVHRQKISGNKPADFELDEGKYKGTYQVKFINHSTSQISLKLNCDYYIIGIKNNNKASIYFYNIKEMGKHIHTNEKGNTFIKHSELKNKPYVIDFSKIDFIIEEIAEKLKEYVSNIFEEVSDLQYNIETIITGVDKNRKVIDLNKIDTYYNNVNNNSKIIHDNLKEIKKIR
jgi:hypothetical protein